MDRVARIAEDVFQESSELSLEEVLRTKEQLADASNAPSAPSAPAPGLSAAEVEELQKRLRQLEEKLSEKALARPDSDAVDWSEEPPVEWKVAPPNYEDAMFWALVTAYSVLGGNKWKYTCKRAYKVSTGLTGWQVPDTPATPPALTAYNACECINFAGGLQGNGVNADHFDIDGDDEDEFFIQPIPVNTPVFLRRVVVAGESVEYWFSVPNGVDGVCP